MSSFSCRFFLHAWKNIHVTLVGICSWSLWSQTCYHHRNCYCVSKTRSIFDFNIWTYISISILIRELLIYLRVIFNTLFGLSTNYWMAITTRFLLGSLNGLLGPVKVNFCLHKNSYWIFTTNFNSSLYTSDCD